MLYLGSSGAVARAFGSTGAVDRLLRGDWQRRRQWLSLFVTPLEELGRLSSSLPVHVRPDRLVALVSCPFPSSPPVYLSSPFLARRISPWSRTNNSRPLLECCLPASCMAMARRILVAFNCESTGVDCRSTNTTVDSVSLPPSILYTIRVYDIRSLFRYFAPYYQLFSSSNHFHPLQSPRLLSLQKCFRIQLRLKFTNGQWQRRRSP